jgi:hypothetical protein
MFTYQKSKGLIGALKLSIGFSLILIFLITLTFYIIPVFAINNSIDIILTPVSPATNINEIRRGDSVNASAQWDQMPNISRVSYQNATGNWINETISSPYTGNWTNTTITIASNWNVGIHLIKLYANNSTGSESVTSTKNFTVWGWAEISEANYTDIPSTSINQSQSATIYCKIRDNVTNYPIENYNVSFYRNSILMGTNLTAFNGHAYYNISSPYTDTVGTYTISCSITNAPPLYYNNSSIKNSQTTTLIINDSTAPSYDNQGPSDGTLVGIGQNVTLYARWTDNVILGYATLWTNETGSWAAKTGVYNSPLSMSGYWSNFTWSNSSIKTQNTVIKWAILANDSSENTNITVNKTFIIRDLNAPTVSDQNQNATIIHAGDVLNLSTVWTDNALLDWSWLSTNETGSWINYTSGSIDRLPRNLTNFSAGPATINFTWQNTSLTAGAISWKIYANDTANNVNVTSPMTFYSYGWANITNATVISSSYNRSTIVPIICLVKDVNSSSAINNYPVRFWKDDTIQYTNYTNTTGHAVWNWNTTLDSVGNHTIKCDIVDNSTLFYNVTSNNSWNASTNLTGILKSSIASSDSIVYRNDSFSPYKVYFTVTIKDELNNLIDNVNVSFWNTTNVPSLLTSCLTSSGFCYGDWNPNDTITPDNYTIEYNATKQFYSILTNTTWIIVKGVLNTNITVISDGNRFYKTKNITMNSTIKDESSNIVIPNYVNWTINTSLMSGIACLTANCDNATWYINESFPLGLYYINATANKSYYDSNSQTKNIQIWGWSSVNISDNLLNISVNTPITFRCKVIDNTTYNAIPNYLVKFYSNVTGIIDSTITDSSGWANLTYVGWSSAGTHNIKCNVTEDSLKYYSTSTQNSNSTILKVYGNLSISSTSEAPFTISPGSNRTSMLRLNMTAYGESINVTSITVYLNGTATAGNITGVELWNDSSGNPGYLISGASTSNPTFPVTFTPTGGINVTGSKIIHILYNISNFSTSLATVGVYMPNDTNISAVGMTSGLNIMPIGAPYLSTLSIMTIRFISAPTLSSPAYDTVTNNSTVTFSWNNVSSAINYTIRIDNNSSDYNSPQFNNTSSYRNYTWPAQEGIWWWWVTTTDNSGVESNPSDRWKLTIDTTPPIINITYPLNNSNWSTSVQLIYTLYDNFSLTLNCSYILDNNASSASVLQNSTTQYILLNAEDGQHNVSINCTDAAGNKNNSDIRFFNVNKHGSNIHSITLDKSPPFYIGGKNITVTVNATDLNGILNVTANNINLTQISSNIWNGNITASNLEGIYPITVVATNVFDNQNTSYSYYIIDNTTPVISNVIVKYPTNKVSVARYENITINATILDPISGAGASGINTSSVIAYIKNVTALQSGLPPINENITLNLIDAANNIYSGQWNSSSLANATTVNINVTAFDKARNFKDDTSKNFTVDNNNFSMVLTALSSDKISATATGSDYWQWTFNLTLYGGTRARMKLADWTDGAGHTISISGNAAMQYQNSSGVWKTYNIKNDYNESESVNPLNDTNPTIDGIQAIIILNMTIPYATYPTTYTTSYGIGIYA